MAWTPRPPPSDDGWGAAARPGTSVWAATEPPPARPVSAAGAGGSGPGGAGWCATSPPPLLFPIITHTHTHTHARTIAPQRLSHAVGPHRPTAVRPRPPASSAGAAAPLSVQEQLDALYAAGMLSAVPWPPRPAPPPAPQPPPPGLGDPELLQRMGWAPPVRALRPPVPSPPPPAPSMDAQLAAWMHVMALAQAGGFTPPSPWPPGLPQQQQQQQQQGGWAHDAARANGPPTQAAPTPPAQATPSGTVPTLIYFEAHTSLTVCVFLYRPFRLARPAAGGAAPRPAARQQPHPGCVRALRGRL
jgi:hypothetical protein